MKVNYSKIGVLPNLAYIYLRLALNITVLLSLVHIYVHILFSAAHTLASYIYGIILELISAKKKL